MPELPEVETIKEDLRELVADGKVPDKNRVRYDMLTRVGYFVTESSEHFSEYVPWFIKRDRPDLIEHYNIPLDEYPRRCERLIARWRTLQPCEVEQAERLEQLRALYHGFAIGVARLEEPALPGIDTAEDLRRAEAHWHAYQGQVS
jgi:alpha-galactosidase